MPDTVPVPEPTVAIAILLLLHVPPAIASVRSVVAPAQTFVAPLIAAGVRFTVTGVVVVQPSGDV